MKIKPFYRQISILLFAINIVFWLGIFIYFSFVKYVDKEEYLVFKILLLGEPVAFGIGLIGYVKKCNLVYGLLLLFLLVNSILSVFDEVGLLDWISLGLNVMLLAVLLVQWKNLFKKSGNYD